MRKEEERMSLKDTEWVTKPYWIYLSCSASQMNLIYCGWQQGKCTSKRSQAQTNVFFLYNEREAGPLVVTLKPVIGQRWQIHKNRLINLYHIKLHFSDQYSILTRVESWWTATTKPNLAPGLCMSLFGRQSVNQNEHHTSFLHCIHISQILTPKSEKVRKTVWPGSGWVSCVKCLMASRLRG